MALVWHGDAVIAQLKGELARKLDLVGRYLRDRTREELSRKQPTRGAATRKRGLDPSQPGEFPKMVTGHLRRNVVTEQEQMPEGPVQRVGTNVVYGKFLELGTSRMLARPWLSQSLQKHHKAMQQIVEA